MSKNSYAISRRKFLFTAGASAAGSILLKGCLGNPPERAGSKIQQVQAINIPPEQMPETKTVTLGIIGQTDAAPLIIAKEKGFFAKYGVTEAQLQKQPSWAVIRDKLELETAGGGLDGAHVLTPMPYLMSLGTITKGNKKVPMILPLRVNIDGQGISVSESLKATGVKLDTSVMKGEVEKAKTAGKNLRFAHTFKGGTSDLMLRYWLAAGGIDPDNDVTTQIVPGSQMVPNMKTGDIQGFSVGEPWHKRAIGQKIGYTAVIQGEIWKDHAEKALAFRKEWADKHPKTLKAVLKAVIEAQQWCDQIENRQEMAEIVAREEYAKVPVADIIDRLKGKIDYGDGRIVENSPFLMRFWDKGNASYPYQSHDLWFLVENQRWGQLPADLDTKKLIAEVNGEKYWRQAAAELGLPAAQIPTSPSKGPEKFFDGVVFDPENPKAYLESLKIKRV